MFIMFQILKNRKIIEAFIASLTYKCNNLSVTKYNCKSGQVKH